MMKRGLVISILILVTVAATLPYGESLASFGRRAVAGRAGKAKAAKRRARARWRRRRAYLRRQRAAAAERRRRRAWALRRRRAGGTTARARRPAIKVTPKQGVLPASEATLRSVLAPAKLPSVSLSAVDAISAIEARVKAVGLAPDPVPAHAAPALAHAAPAATPRPLVPVVSPSPLMNPSPLAGPAPLSSAPAPVAAPAAARAFTSLPVPRSWQNVSSTLAGEFKFSVRGSDGRAAGTAVWSRVALAPTPHGTDRRAKTLGGFAHAAMRRVVIDRMVAEGGWVVNDFERELGGQRVFVVVAQSEGEGGARRSWTYYFAETDGRLYSLSTATPAQFADALAADAEQVVSSVLSRSRAAAAPAKN